MRLGLDTNVLAYAEGLAHKPDDLAKVERCRRLTAGLLADPAVEMIVPIQALAELYNVLTRKGGLSHQAAETRLAAWMRDSLSVPTTALTFSSAVGLAGMHRLEVFDAMILAAACEGGATVLVSEDLQDGLRWGGVVVVSPFGPDPDGLLSAWP